MSTLAMGCISFIMAFLVYGSLAVGIDLHFWEEVPWSTTVLMAGGPSLLLFLGMMAGFLMTRPHGWRIYKGVAHPVPPIAEKDTSARYLGRVSRSVLVSSALMQCAGLYAIFVSLRTLSFRCGFFTMVVLLLASMGLSLRVWSSHAVYRRIAEAENGEVKLPAQESVSAGTACLP
jgi:hypothetical protein